MDSGNRKRKILIVDDEVALIQIYQLALEAEGYEIKVCEDGEAALQLAKEFQPDLILLDVMMPRLSGFEALDILRNTAETKTAIIIIMSAIGDSESLAKAKSLGAQDYIVKSNASLEDVMAKVRSYLSDETSDLDPNTLNNTTSV